MNNRVVVTGLGLVAPNGINLESFTEAIKAGRSGITYHDKLASLNFRCQVAGVPNLDEIDIGAFCQKYNLKKLRSSGVLYGCMAGIEAWNHAGLELASNDDTPDWNSGCIFGSGMTGVENIDFAIRHIDQGRVKSIGGRAVQQAMSSSISAYLGGLLGLGNQVTSNSSACATGTESILMAYNRIKMGYASRMLAGGCDSKSEYIWGSFDSMRALSGLYNDNPEKASRPMSASAKGFVPGAGAGALILETLESAQQRGAKIYAEILGGASNSGGHLQGGSMTMPNSNGVIRCLKMAIERSNIQAEDIDAIAGHLTSTMADPLEIKALTLALGREGEQFPYINSLKSMIGHCLSAAGAIESVAVVKQLEEGFFHPSINCEDVHPEIEALIAPHKIPNKIIQNTGFNIIAKTSFGFGDVNTCIIFKKWN